MSRNFIFWEKYFLSGFPGIASSQGICLKFTSAMGSGFTFTSAMGIQPIPFNDGNLAFIHGSDVNQRPIPIELVNQTKIQLAMDSGIWTLLSH